MAATIDIEIESGVFSGPVQHHRGYYAGDFSQTPRSGDEPRVPHAERRDVPRTWQ